ncbi:MAG: hypothetical protein FJ399_00440 [Verrucomicrobia bacterium]|nr:hypothetical protein [Verrucomicrobiota bacterium]
MEEPSFTPEEIRELMELLARKGWLAGGETKIEPAGGHTAYLLTEKGRFLAAGLAAAAEDLDTNPRLLYLAAKLFGRPDEQPPFSGRQ